MSRLTPSLFALLAATAWAAPALAEDFDAFRDAYPVTPAQWAGLGDEDDPIKIEFGVRYWYAIGGQSFSDGGGSSLLTSSDIAHAGELHLRVEDHATNSYAKAIAGYTFAINGSYADPIYTGTFADGHVGYVGADFGWNAFGDNAGSGVGFLVGYQYWQDAPNTGRNNFTTATTTGDVGYDPVTGQTFLPGDSAPNSVDMHMLRLGVSGKANIAGFLDISAEVAAVPYAKVSGTVGVDDPTFDTSVYGGPSQMPYDSVAIGNISSMRSSATSIDGWGYGAMAEGWVGVHPVDNLTFRVGARAWYLQGTVDQTYSAVSVGNPGDADIDGVYDTDPVVTNANYISVANPFAMFRYGLLAELTYAF